MDVSIVDCSMLCCTFIPKTVIFTGKLGNLYIARIDLKRRIIVSLN